jgi:hypothetical protein
MIFSQKKREDIMSGKDVTEMSLRVIRRLRVIRDVLEGKLTGSQASGQIGLSGRQVRRLTKAVGERGDVGIIHGLRGKESDRRIGSVTKERVLRLCQTGYAGFGPTLAGEKLRESDGIGVSSETLRTWLKEAGPEGSPAIIAPEMERAKGVFRGDDSG